MEVYGYVYLIRNKVNGKVYVGQTTATVRERWMSHCSQARRCITKMAISAAICKYGVDEFDVVEIHRAYNKEELNEMEIRSILVNNSTCKEYGYNNTLGGEGGKWTDERKDEWSKKVSGQLNPHFGKHHTLATRTKMSIDRAGLPSTWERTNEYRALIGNIHRGKIVSEITKKNISESKKGKSSPNKGKVYSPEVCLAMSVAAKRKWELSSKVPTSGAWKKGQPAHNKGKTNSEEAKAKMRLSSQKRWADPEARKRSSDTTKRVNAERRALAEKDKI